MLLSLLLPISGMAQVVEFTDRGAWEAAAGAIATAPFTGFSDGTVITDQYQSLGLVLVQGDDRVLSSNSFLVDGKGLHCDGDLAIQFAGPVGAIGVDFPGALHIKLYSGNSLVWSSSNFAGSGAGFFAGLTSTTAFDRALISDGADGQAFMDEVSFAEAGIQLAFSGSCSSAASVNIADATSNGDVAIAIAPGPGSFVVPFGPCAGTVLGIGSGVSLVAIVAADASGAASLSGNLPASLCGRLLQAVDLGSCETSNVAPIP